MKSGDRSTTQADLPISRGFDFLHMNVNSEMSISKILVLSQTEWVR
jgi:hypothetical protein